MMKRIGSMTTDTWALSSDIQLFVVFALEI